MTNKDRIKSNLLSSFAKRTVYDKTVNICWSLNFLMLAALSVLSYRKCQNPVLTLCNMLWFTPSISCLWPICIAGDLTKIHTGTKQNKNGVLLSSVYAFSLHIILVCMITCACSSNDRRSAASNSFGYTSCSTTVQWINMTHASDFKVNIVNVWIYIAESTEPLLCHFVWNFPFKVQETSKRAQEIRVTKKLYIVFKYSKLLNKYKMCSQDLHIGQYKHCPDLILFTCSPLPTQHAKLSANYSHLFCAFSLSPFLSINWKSWQLSIWTKTTQTEHLEQFTV